MEVFCLDEYSGSGNDMIAVRIQGRGDELEVFVKFDAFGKVAAKHVIEDGRCAHQLDLPVN